MKKYIGVKEILARPMTRKEYNDYRGWELPSDENGEDEGFLVEYVQSEKSPNVNHPNHKGYISWSPKDVFEDAYISINSSVTHPQNLQPHQERVVKEMNDLSDKCEKLSVFINSDLFTGIVSEPEQKRLKTQLLCMSAYLEVLKDRINNI
jgi:hypothetical protein